MQEEVKTEPEKTEKQKPESEMTTEELLANTEKSVGEKTRDEKEKRDAAAKAEKEANVFKGPPPPSRNEVLKAAEEEIADKAKEGENIKCPECGSKVNINLGQRRLGNRRGRTFLVGNIRCSSDTCDYSGKYRRVV